MTALRCSAIAAALVAAFFMLGCTTVDQGWGLSDSAETPPETRAYVHMSRYVYGAIPLAIYAEDPGGAEGIKTAACRLDPYDEMRSALETVRLGGDGVAVALAVLSKLALDVSEMAAGGPLEVGFGDGRRIAVVVSRSLAAGVRMRAWRRATARRVSDMVAEERPPSEEEWATVERQTARMHGPIQAACAGRWPRSMLRHSLHKHIEALRAEGRE